MGKQAKPYAKRIVGHGDEPLDAILFNPANWRIHPKAQQDALEGVLSQVGWVQDVIINRTTGHLVDGHLRCQVASRNGEETIPVVYVELSEAEEALVLASIDPIAAMAATDKEKLDALTAAIQSEDERVNALIADIREREKIATAPDDSYSRKIEAPIYEPKGDKPSVKDLFDDTRAKELLAEIEAADLPEDEKEFLRIAARRHTVLNYKRIAEYYAHSPAHVQRLMENSALVIIDFDRAIELGYVKLSEEIAKQYAEDYPDD